MRKTLSALLWLTVLSGAAVFAADQSIGRIDSLSGKVLIDQFGKGAFIAAARGDQLYPATVLRTPADGSARVELQGRGQDIPAGATVRVSDLLASGARRAGMPWFSAMGNLIRSFTDAVKGREETKTLGDRAGDKSTAEVSDGMDWALDEADPSALLPQAQEQIRAGRYASALEILAKAEAPADPFLAWDLSFWRGFCFFQVEDYADAVKHHLAAQATGRPGAPENERMRLFQLGASYYMLGQEKAAIGPLETFMAARKGDPVDPYAALTLARALSATGETARARAVAEEGRRTWQGTALEKEFSALLR
jgi:Flp pilus assembly protein TadD